MNLFFNIFLISTGISLVRSHTHDEISKCSLTGVHKTRQTILESPNYPRNYTRDTCWDYVIRSPFRCATKFHTQFLDFFLEPSKDCVNDYLAIGLDNIDDDMDVLCGQVVGIKKYHTPDGVLRLRFFADDTPGGSTGKGFKLLITRLACEKEEVLRELEDPDIADDDSITITAPAGQLQPPHTQIMDIIRNFTGIEQHQVYPSTPVFNLNYPTQLPTPPYPGYGGYYSPQAIVPQQNYFSSPQNTLEKPCREHGYQQQEQQSQPNRPTYTINNNNNNKYLSSTGRQQFPYLPGYVTNSNSNNNNYLPILGDQYVGTWPSQPQSMPVRARDGSSFSLETCCTSGFKQKRFYLSSPGFPRTIFSNLLSIERRDCEFNIQKQKDNVCRLRIDFKFFDFGQSFHGTGAFEGNIGLPAIESSKNTCTEDYIEIDNERFCGCRSDNVFTALWNYQGDKKIRMRMGYSGVPSGGFLLEMSQEECTDSQFSNTGFGSNTGLITEIGSNSNRYIGNKFGNYPISQGGYLPGVPQQSGYPQQSGIPHHSAINQQTRFEQQTGYVPQYNPNQHQQFPHQPHYLAQQPFISNQGFISPIPQNHMHPQLPNNFYLPTHQHQQSGVENNHLQSYPYSSQQLRYARSYGDTKYPNQPLSVVETNSTRKEYYFSDSENNNHNNNNDNLNAAMSRSSRVEGIQAWENENVRAPPKDNAAVRQKCSFSMTDILRLSVDVLWLTKPTCYAPQRNWLTNWLG